MKYQHVVAEVFRKPWAILPEKLSVIAQLVALRASGGKLSQEEIKARLDEAALTAGPRNGNQNFGAVAVIPIRGVISHRANLMSQFSGGTSIDKLTAQFRQALGDASIKAIVFDVESPGGGVEGVPELAEEIYKSRSQKKTVAVANGFAASAAYWIAASAGEMVVIPSGQVGSVGVFAAHEDLSKAMEQAGVKVSLVSSGKYKTEGNEFEPLSDEARAELQAKVDAFYGMFVKSVGRGRAASQESVRSGFGQGRMVLAADAVKMGMADRVATMDDTLKRLGAGMGNPARMAASGSGTKLQADTEDGDPDQNLDDPLDETDCLCMCEACRADNCAGCSNPECNDPNCEHGSRAMSAVERRRRELDLL